MEEIQYLIRALEKEQADLGKLIDEAVQEGDYLIAHFHSQAISFVARQLQTLKNLDDKAYDSKRFLKSRINQLTAMLNGDKPDKFNYYLRSEIQKLEGELDSLNQRGKQGSPTSEILTGYLESLVNHEISCVKVVLKKSSNFVLDISRQPAGIILEIPNLKSLENDDILYEESLQHFFGLGFATDGAETKLTLRIMNGENKDLLAELQIIICRIVFEIFYFKEFEGETFIEIVE